ncbi:hypothetical protein LLE49_07560 [Alicyclobacillus tolerans]|uniref:CBO0543 family protein n=1 Tax=Alicyclobacillus tolerans TaxID=90970 RepID=UPI001F44CC62|nr:CBO0543 family protein [Alicyclobacillus tolerans]MCF8564601.1 hypothetical protein [Alicyclobacillus tolerans]
MSFLIVSVVVLNVAARMMPKRLTAWEVWTTSLFALVCELVVNIVLDLKFDFYGYFEKGVQGGSFIAIFGLFPSANTIFLNFYPFGRHKWQKVLYILGSSGFCVIFEYASLKSGYFYYHGWKLWYSALFYPPLLWLMVLNLQLTRRLR